MALLGYGKLGEKKERGVLGGGWAPSACYEGKNGITKEKCFFCMCVEKN
jgi:hypothetical protein